MKDNTKLTKTVAKTGVRNLLILALQMLAFCAVTFCITKLSYLGTEFIGHPTACGGVPCGDTYRANFEWAVFCWIIQIILFIIFYAKCLKVGFKKQLHTHWLFVLLFFVLVAAFCFAELLTYIFAALSVTSGLFDRVTNYPDNMFCILLLCLTAYITIDIILEVRKQKVKKVTR